jgi:hypothetical protein
MRRKASKISAVSPVPPLRVKPDAWSAYAVEPWPIAQLVPNARNAKLHSARQVRKIAALIARVGWTMPVLVDEAGVILAGHGRALAAKLLDLADVPVIVARGWSDADKRAYLFADNQIGESAGYDRDLLAVELAELAELPDLDCSLSDLGFTDAELRRLLPKAKRATTAAPAAIAARVMPRTRRGDVWQLGGHRLTCAADASVDDLFAADAALSAWEGFAKKTASLATGEMGGAGAPNTAPKLGTTSPPTF